MKTRITFDHKFEKILDVSVGFFFFMVHTILSYECNKTISALQYLCRLCHILFKILTFCCFKVSYFINESKITLISALNRFERCMFTYIFKTGNSIWLKISITTLLQCCNHISIYLTAACLFHSHTHVF